MNWFAFGVLVWLSLGLHWGFRDALRLGMGEVAPYFPVIALVYVALWAPMGHALAGAVVIGALWDVASQVPVEGGGYTVMLGPHALGCLLAGYAVVTLRGVLLRKNVLTVGVVAVLGAALSQLVVVFLVMVRSLYDVVVLDDPLVVLGSRMGSAVYTGVAGVVLAPVLVALRPLFAFRPIGGTGFRAP